MHVCIELRGSEADTADSYAIVCANLAIGSSDLYVSDAKRRSRLQLQESDIVLVPSVSVHCDFL